jgi:hypothetical protein
VRAIIWKTTKSPAFVSIYTRPWLSSSFKQVFNRCRYHLNEQGVLAWL